MKILAFGIRRLKLSYMKDSFLRSQADPVEPSDKLSRTIRAKLAKHVAGNVVFSAYLSGLGIALIVLVYIGSGLELGMMLPMLALRGASLTYNHLLARRILTSLAAEQDYSKSMRRLRYALGLEAFTWGALLWPLGADPQMSYASFIVTTISIVALCLLATVTSGYRLATRHVQIWAGLALLPQTLLLYPFVGPGLPIGLFCLLVVLGYYARLLERQARATVVLQVRNQQISNSLTAANDALNNALEQARWFADHDPLTGLFNRRAFETAVASLPTGDARGASYIVLIDLDHFKQINDRLGHDTGDAVLAEVGNLLGEWASEASSRVVARWGGEEFIACLQPAHADNPMREVEQLRERIGELGVRESWLNCPAISASIGCAPLAGPHSLLTTVTQADTALYAAKHAGRNCFRLAA